ncbi:MAG: hypothetical protein LPH21_14790 [Shewanella sp.]|nr:hypothetical protein [Shewanella sp.]
MSEWLETIESENQEFVREQEWATPNDVINSYRSLQDSMPDPESYVMLPGDSSSEEETNAFYQKLGRPEDPEKYNIEMKEGEDHQLHSWFKQSAFQAGLSEKQASNLYNAWTEMSEKRSIEIEEQLRKDSESAIEKLKAEHGTDYDNFILAGRNAVNAMGYDEEKLAKIEKGIGTSEMMSLFAQIGKNTLNDEFHIGLADKGSNFATNKENAKLEIERLQNDPEFMKKYMDGDKDAIARMKNAYELGHNN